MPWQAAAGSKHLPIVDDFTKESVDIVADHAIGGQYVTRVLA
jgi:putative transposase